MHVCMYVCIMLYIPERERMRLGSASSSVLLEALVVAVLGYSRHSAYFLFVLDLCWLQNIA